MKYYEIDYNEPLGSIGISKKIPRFNGEIEFEKGAGLDIFIKWISEDEISQDYDVDFVMHLDFEEAQKLKEFLNRI